mgnify:FL=1
MGKKWVRNDQGIALPLVLAVMAVMTILSVAAFNVSTNQTLLVQKSIDRDEALYAAEQGYNHYLWKLNDDDIFYLDTTEYDCDTSESGFDVYTLIGEETGNYRVQIRVAREIIDGIEVPVRNRIVLRSTGWSENDSDHLRTIEVEVSKRTFTQHAMVTNNEINEYGDELYWVDDEVMYGPLHTNDTLYIGDYDPIFYGPVTYVNRIDISPENRISSNEVFRQGNSQADPLEFVSSNTDLLSHARIGGHYYNGCTYIYLKGDKYDIRRWDKDANTWKFNEVAYTPPTSYQNTNKREREEAIYKHTASGKQYSSFAALRSDTANFPSLDLPANGVIYVNGSTGDNGENSHNRYVYKFDRDFGNVFVCGQLDGKLTIAAANDLFITGHDPCDWRRPNRISNFNRGINEDNKPGVTYSTTDFSQIMNGSDWVRTEVEGNGDDMLGLVAGQCIRIIHYNWPSQLSSRDWCWGGKGLGNRIDTAPDDIYIHAALFVRDISYGFEYAEDGSNKGEINLVGSITQRYRGFVGTTGGTGYNKIYSHDPRMLYDAPPYFVEPANTGWLSAKWRETSEHVPE